MHACMYGGQGSGKRRDTRGDGYSSDDDDGDLDDSGEGSGGEDEGDALLRDSAALKGGRGGILEPGYLNIVRRVCIKSILLCTSIAGYFSAVGWRRCILTLLCDARSR